MMIDEIDEFLAQLESGERRVVEWTSAMGFTLNTENKEKVMQVFALSRISEFSQGVFKWRDKIHMLSNMERFRVVPGAVVRRGVFIGDGAIIMPSFINIGVHVGAQTMIDSGATVGSCAYVGNKCHISSCSVVAGVLEPISSMPVIIEDDVFVGAQCLVSEGVRVGRGAVLAAGVKLTSSAKLIDRASGAVYKDVPEYSVVVPGCYKSDNAYIQCSWIVKQVDEKARSKTSINDLLRDIV